MAKFSGSIGYVVNQETAPGVFTDVITEKEIKGDLLRNAQSWSPNVENLNDDFTITNRFSVISNAYLRENLSYIAYLKWSDVKWRVVNVEVIHPRTILTVRGVYNGN